jgi:hypothetical protein
LASALQCGFADAGEERFGWLVGRVLSDKVATEGIGEELFVESFSQFVGTSNLFSQLADARESTVDSVNDFDLFISWRERDRTPAHIT